MPKILPDGTVTYEPGREPGGPREHPGYGEPMTGIEHPADGTWSPPVSNEDGEEVRVAVTVIPAGDGEPPDPIPAPGQDQGSTPPLNSPGSSVPPDEPAQLKPAPARAPRKADVDA
jgi:hypothetical protein